MIWNRSTRLRRTVLAVLALTAATASAAPAVAGPGGFRGLFDEPECDVAHCLVRAGDPTGLRPWSVDQGSVDLTPDSFWQSQSGTNSIDLSGTGPGTISQRFVTTPGSRYQVTYWVAGNPSCGATVKKLRVLFDGLPIGAASFDTTGRSFTDMGWTRHRAVGTATGTTSTIEFVETTRDGTFCGAALDSVRVYALP